MKLKMYFLMLALGVCGAAMQSCDDDDDNLKVPEKLQSAFSQKYPEASPKWKTRGNYYIADFQDQNYGEFYQFNLSSCIRQQNSLTAQFVSFSLSNLANIFYPPQFLQ